MKKFFHSFLVLIWLFSPIGCKGKKEVVETPDTLFEKGKIYENIKQYPNAIEMYNKVLEKKPFLLEVYLRKGDCYKALGNYNEALETYKKGFVIDNKNLDLSRSLAETYYLKGDYKLSLEYSELVREQQSTDPFALNLIGKIYSAQGNMEESALWLQRAMDNDPSNAVFLLDFIRTLIAQEKIDEAIVLSETFLRDKKEAVNLDVSLMYVDLLMRMNRFEEAIQVLTQLDEKNQQNSEILSRIARYHFIHEDDDKTLTYLNQSLEKNPSHLQSLLLKGSLLLKQGKGAEAIVIFQGLARNFPNWPDVQLKLGAAYQLLGQWEQSKTAYRRLLQMVPGFIPAQVALANIYFRDSWYEEVEKICEEIFEKEPENVDALKIYAASLLTQKKYKEAITVYKKISELLPEMKQSYSFLAELYLSSGDFQTAYLEAQKALKESPDDSRMLLISGLCLKYLNLTDQAQSVFQRIVEQDPDYFPARFQLGELYATQKLWEAAEEQYQAILNKQPENMDVLIGMGSVYWHQEKYEKAETFFLDLLEKYPEEYRLYYELGRLYTKQKKIDEAIEKFKSLVEKKPQHLLGNLLLANLYRQKGDIKTAETIMRSLIEARPALNLENELVLLQLAQGKVDEALTTIRTLPVAKQSSTKTQFVKGIALLLANEAEDAIITFRRLQEKLPYNVLFLVAYADSYLELGSEEKAVSTFQTVFKEFPSLSQWYESFVKELNYSEKEKTSLDKIHYFLLFAYFQWGVQLEKAFEELPPAAAKNPLFQTLLADAYAVSDKADKANEIYLQIGQKFPKSSYLYYRLGHHYLKQGNKVQASQSFLTALNLNPDSTRIRIPLIQLLIESKQFAEAEQVALDALKQDPKESSIYYLLVDLYSDQKRFSQAVELMNRLYELKPEDANAALKLGQLYFSLHDYEKSADILKLFVLRNPKNILGNSLYLRALLASDREDELVRLINSLKQNLPQINTTMPEIMFYLKKKEFLKAMRLMQQIDSSAFGSGPNLFVMGLVFQGNGDLAQAKKYFLMGSEKTNDKLLYLLAYLNLLRISVSSEEFNKEINNLLKDPDGTPSYAEMLSQIVQSEDSSKIAAELFNLNMVYLKILNSWDKKAHPELQQWLERFPQNLFLQRVSYFIAQRVGWQEKGNVSLETILKYYPDDIFSLMQLGRHNMTKRNEIVAASYFEKVLTLMPENQEALTFLAMLYSNQGNSLKALELYEKALQLNETNIIALNNMADLYSRPPHFNLDQALNYAEKAQKLAPGNGAVADTLGWIYYQQGRYAEALVYLERAKQIVPKLPEVYFHLGKTYVALQDSGKAKEAFEQVLKLAPDGKHSEETKKILSTL